MTTSFLEQLLDSEDGPACSRLAVDVFNRLTEDRDTAESIMEELQSIDLREVERPFDIVLLTFVEATFGHLDCEVPHWAEGELAAILEDTDKDDDSAIEVLRTHEAFTSTLDAAAPDDPEVAHDHGGEG